ncbi:MAG: prepilin peptidase [Candidatus Dormibacteria bacterium]
MLPLAGLAAIAGVGLGIATHRFNDLVRAGEEDAVEPPLPREPLWAPILDAALLAFLFYRFGVSGWSLAATPVIVVLVQVVVFDARHRLILNRVMYPAAAAALLLSFGNPLIHGQGMTWHGRVVAAVLGAAVAGGIFFVISVISRGGIGLGDAKLCFFLGAVLGGLPLPVSAVMVALIMGVMLGGVV